MSHVTQASLKQLTDYTIDDFHAAIDALYFDKSADEPDDDLLEMYEDETYDQWEVERLAWEAELLQEVR